MEAVSHMAYWQGYRKDVEAYVASCKTCQKFKTTNRAATGELMPLGVSKGRWTEVTMDFAGPLPMTKNGHDLIVVFVDRFSNVEKILKRLYEGYVLAKAHLEEAQERMVNQGNRCRCNHNYHVGDEVWLQSKHVKYGPNKSTTFDVKWLGPYKIERLGGRNPVQLTLPPEMKVHRTFNVDRIKPRIGEDPPGELEDLMTKHAVEEVTDECVENGIKKVKLKFRNENPQDKWVSREDSLKRIGPEFLDSLAQSSIHQID